MIGASAKVDGPYGLKDLVYADYVASGRALRQVETFVLEEVLPYYANSHTEASFCGAMMTRMRREARATIAECCGADSRHAVIFAGSGATAGINRLVKLLGVEDAVTTGKPARVIIGPYEHHSNILPWRESGAEIIEIQEGCGGGPDLILLEKALEDSRDVLTICSFSAASNITGILTDIEAVTRLAKSAGAKILWDFAGAGPYIPITMTPAEGAEIDAIVVSPHKFLGGPGASGILVVRRDAVVGLERIASLNENFTARAFEAWQGIPQIELLGSMSMSRLPIFSFRIRDGKGGYVHQQLITRMLSDRFGIQARGGCACAGPYVHRLLSIDDEHSEQIRQSIRNGNEIEKPGFTRLNLSVLHSEEKVRFILEAVIQLARDAPSHTASYMVDRSRAIFSPLAQPLKATA
jgi:selenocysteine lyase/cysteine desulfurase